MSAGVGEVLHVLDAFADEAHTNILSEEPDRLSARRLMNASTR